MKIYCEELNREYDSEALEKRSGILKYGGRILYQIRDVHPNDLLGHEDEYTAMAIDEQGYLYIVVWNIINFETEDGAETCNWDNYSVREF